MKKVMGVHMARIRPEDGARPWLPASDVTLLEEYHVWNIPLAGLVKQAEDRYLFTCLFGEESTESVWAYAPVTEEDIAQLGELSGAEFASAVDDSLANKSLVVAFADDNKLDTWQMIDSGEEPPAQIVRRFIDLWQLSLREQKNHADDIARSRELVDA